MATLNIKLNQEYKSFPNGFEVSLEGDLIVISWVNGSGKSQLMEVIKWHQVNDPNKIIQSSMAINWAALNSKNILHRSFQSNIQQVHNIGNAEPQNFKNHKNSVWNNYTNSVLLNENHQNLRNFQKASKNAKRLLIDKFGEEKFNRGEIKQEEIIATIPDTFIWESDDIFANIVADSFLMYANEFNNIKLQNTLDNFLEDAEIEEKLWVPPWKKLNDLFEFLKIDYRFNESYRARLSWLDEQPRLYPLINGTIDKQSPRQITDLSDGEKVIASLIFSTLNTNDWNDITLLLLDEFDATFNPSLTEMFYKVIEEYFIKKWTVVIIVTHSPTTISLAPECASFYEVFRKWYDQRILPVQKEEYNELKIANKEFYEKIGNQKERIKELEEKTNNLESIVKNIELSDKEYILFVEWETDVSHITFAKQKLWISELNFDIFDCWGADKLKAFLIWLPKTIFSGKKIIWIFDYDQKWMTCIRKLCENFNEVTGGYQSKSNNNVYAITLPVTDENFENFENFPIEFLYPKSVLDNYNFLIKRSLSEINNIQYVRSDENRVLNKTDLEQKEDLCFFSHRWIETL